MVMLVEAVDGEVAILPRSVEAALHGFLTEGPGAGFV